MDHIKALMNEKSKAETSITSIEHELLRLEGNVQGSEAVLKSLACKLQTKTLQIKDLIEDFGDDEDMASALFTLRIEEQSLKDALDYAHKSLNSEKKNLLQNKLSLLTSSVASLSNAICYWNAKRMHLRAIQQHSSAEKCLELRMGIYKLPIGNESNVCVACGLLYTSEYHFIVKMKCQHIYHVRCFEATAEARTCIVQGCNSKVPSGLMQELGYNLKAVEETEADDGATKKSVKKVKHKSEQVEFDDIICINPVEYVHCSSNASPLEVSFRSDPVVAKKTSIACPPKGSSKLGASVAVRASKEANKDAACVADEDIPQIVVEQDVIVDMAAQNVVTRKVGIPQIVPVVEEKLCDKDSDGEPGDTIEN